MERMQNTYRLNRFQYRSLDKILCDIASFKKEASDFRVLRFYWNVSALFAFQTMTLAESGTSPENILPDGLGNAKNFIHAHYGEKIGMEKIARIACFSKGHFQREFKRKFGFSPLEYLNGSALVTSAENNRK